MKTIQPLSVKAAMAQAKKVELPTPYVGAYEFAEVIHFLLTKRNMSCRDVQSWCAERGHHWCLGTIYRARNHWQTKKGKR